MDRTELDFVGMTADIVSAYVTNNSVTPADLPKLIADVHAGLIRVETGTGVAATPEVPVPTPTQIRRSIRADGIVSFLDGKVYRTLSVTLPDMAIPRNPIAPGMGCPRTIRWSPRAIPSSARRSPAVSASGVVPRPRLTKPRHRPRSRRNPRDRPCRQHGQAPSPDLSARTGFRPFRVWRRTQNRRFVLRGGQ